MALRHGIYYKRFIYTRQAEKKSMGSVAYKRDPVDEGFRTPPPVTDRKQIQRGSSKVSAHSRGIPRGALAAEDFWRRVRRVYSTGKHTDDEVAQKFAHEGLTLAALQSKRSRDRKKDPTSWPQSLQGDVAVATRAILAQQAVLEEGGKADAVMAAARQVANVLTVHRHDAGQARQAVMEVVGELRRATVGVDQWQTLLEACSKDLTAEERSALRQQFKHALALHSRAGSIHKAADALLKTQIAERKAWGVAEDPKDANPLDALNDAQLQAEITRLQDDIDRLVAASGGKIVPLHGPKA